MRKILVIFAVATLGLVSAEMRDRDGVLVLDRETLAGAQEKYPSLLVNFYSASTPGSQELEPEFGKVAARLRAQGSLVKLGKVDVEADLVITMLHNVTDLPTLRLYSAGETTADYTGHLSAQGILSWLKKKSGPAAPVITEVSELNQLKENQVAVVGYFKDLESDAAKAFIETASKFENIPFSITSDENLFSESGVNSTSAAVLFKHFDEKRNDFSGDFTTDSLVSFVKERSLPLVTEYNLDKSREIFRREINTHLLLFGSKNMSSCLTALENAKKVAENYRGKIKLVWADSGKDDTGPLMSTFGVKVDRLPAYRLVYLNGSVTRKFKPSTDDVSEDSIAAFLAQYKANELQSFLVTDDLPSDWDTAPVKVLVGTNYNEVTRGSGKKVVVEIYAPWCGFCKELEPIWKELGEKYRNDPDVIVAKFDATTNEVEGLTVDSYPTIKLYLPGAEEAIDFDGEVATLEALSQFVDSAVKEQSPEGGETEKTAHDAEHTEL